jgi:hypothetical protein
MFTSALPMVADPRLLVPLWGAWMVSSVLYRRQAEAPIGFRPWMSNDLRLLATDLLVAVRALRGKSLETDLLEPAPGRRARTVILIGLQVVLGVALSVFGLGIVRPAHGDFVTLASLALAGWLWVMVFQARTGMRLRQARQNYRTFDELPVLASDGRMGVIGVSPFGLDVVSSKALTVGSNVRITFALPQVDGTSVRFDCPTTVRRSGRQGNHHLAYLRFAQLTDTAVDQITEYCAVFAGHQALRDPSVGDDPAVVAIEGAVLGSDDERIEVAELS